MMLEGQNFQPLDGHRKSGGKNFVNTMSNKFEKLMNKKFKEAVKHIIENPDKI